MPRGQAKRNPKPARAPDGRYIVRVGGRTVLRALSPDQERALVSDYNDGSITVRELLKKYDISLPTLYNILNRHKTYRPRGRGSWAEKELTLSEMKRIWAEYVANKISLPRLAKKWGITTARIFDIGDQLGRTERRRPNHRGKSRKLSDAQELRVCKMYTQGKVEVDEIAAKFDIDRTTLYDILHRRQVTVRRQAPASGEAVLESGRYLKQQRKRLTHPDE